MGMRAPQDQFELARKRAQQDANVAKQTQSDSISRRFAAQGMSGSGSEIQQNRLANEAVDKQLSERADSIDSAQQQEVSRKKEVQEQRNFARDERVASQNFASGERASGQTFAASESAMGRALQGSQFDRQFKQQGSQFDRQFDRQGTQRTEDVAFRDTAAKTSADQFGQTFGLAKEQFAQDRKVTDFNATIAGKQAGVMWTGFGESGAGGQGLSQAETDKLMSERAKEQYRADTLAAQMLALNNAAKNVRREGSGSKR